MSYTIASIDRDTLPAALLDLAKLHLRVTFADDDETITQYLRWAIAYFEQFSGWRVFAAQVSWLPDITLTDWYYQCPVQPVASFIVMSEGTDVSSQYALQASEPVAPVYLVHSDCTPWPGDAAVSLVAGYADPDDIEPNALGDILRITGTLYEHRESVSVLGPEQMLFWMNDLLSGTWIPRA